MKSHSLKKIIYSFCIALVALVASSHQLYAQNPPQIVTANVTIYPISSMEWYKFYNIFLRITENGISRRILLSGEGVRDDYYKTTVKYCSSGEHDLELEFEFDGTGNRTDRKNTIKYKDTKVTNDGNQRLLASDRFEIWANFFGNNQKYAKVDYSFSYSCPYFDIPDNNEICAKKIGEDVSGYNQEVSPRKLEIGNPGDFTNISWHWKNPATQQFQLINSRSLDRSVLDLDNLSDASRNFIHGLDHGSHTFVVRGRTAVTTGLRFCTIEKEFVVNFLNTPNAFEAIESVTHSFCNGEVVELSGPDVPANQSYNYQWKQGITTLSCSKDYNIYKPGNYSLVVQDNDGCYVKQDFTVKSSFAAPIELEVPANGKFCVSEGGNIVVEIMNAHKYEYFNWSTAPNVNSPLSSLTITEPGNYWVSAKDKYSECRAFYEIVIEECDNTLWDGSGGGTWSRDFSAKNPTPAHLKLPLVTNTDPDLQLRLNAPGRSSDPLSHYIAFARLEYEQDDDYKNESVYDNWFYHVKYAIKDIATGNYITNGDWVKIQKNALIKNFESVNKYYLSDDNNKRLLLEILEVEASVNGQQQSIPPQDINLTLELRALPKREISAGRRITGLRGTTNLTDRRVALSWTPVKEAHEYEVQIGWRDQFSNIYPTTTSGITKLLKNEGWNYTVNEASAVLDLTFPEGELFVRVRPVGEFVQGNLTHKSEKKYGKWSAFFTIDLRNNGFEPDKNWQKTITYAEDGKKKEVVTYMDNLLRARQVQTNLNTEQLTLVAETYYDSESRPVVNILPVPLMKNNLLYEENLTRSVLSGNPSYSKADFERIEQIPVSTISGAGQYYSSSNPFKNSSVSRVNIDLIPDATVAAGNGIPAGAYVHTLVQYERDQTGKPFITGGVGAEFRVGSRGTSSFPEIHPTRHFYSDVSPTELKRLFGPSVWDASQYTKEMTIDPNGQVSYTYKDKSGKVVATALAGPSPANLHALEPLNRTIPIYHSLDEKLNRTDRSLFSEFRHTISNEMEKNYQFEYTLDGIINSIPAIQKGTIKIDPHCKTCVYNLEMYILGPDGMKIELGGLGNNMYYIPDLELGAEPVNADAYSNKEELNACGGSNTHSCLFQDKTIRYRFLNNPNVDYECPVPVKPKFQGGIIFNVTLPEQGVYTLVRNLQLAPEGLEIYRKSLEEGDVRITTEVEPRPDCWIESVCDCDQCEATCFDAVVAYRENNRDFDNPYENDGIFVFCDPSTWLGEETQVYNDCVSGNCNNNKGLTPTIVDNIANSECSYRENILKKDVSPGGFWFNHKIGSIDYIVSTEFRNTLSESIDGWAENEEFETLREGTKLQIEAEWNDDWANYLVIGHPEFCHWAMYCGTEAVLASKRYEIQMESVSNWTEAEASIFLNPANDPISTISGEMDVNDLLRNWTSIVNNNFPMLFGETQQSVETGMGLLQILDVNQIIPDNSEINRQIIGFRESIFLKVSDFPGNIDEVNRENSIRKWVLFKGLYHSEKKRRLELIERDNGCNYFAKNIDVHNFWRDQPIPENYYPMYTRSLSILNDKNDEESLLVAYDALCEGQALGTLDRIVMVCGIEMSDIVGIPENKYFSNPAYIQQCKDIFAGTIISLTKYCQESVGVDNPMGWLTKDILQEYADYVAYSTEGNNKKLYPFVADVLNALEADINNTDLSDKLDIITCLKSQLSNGAHYNCEASSVPVIRLDECEDHDDLEGFTPPIEPGMITLCNTKCIQSLVDKALDKKSFGNTLSISGLDCEGYSTLIRKPSDFMIDIVHYSSPVFSIINQYATLWESFSVNKPRSSESTCDNCYLNFMFIDENGSKIKNIESVSFAGYDSRENPIERTIPTDPQVIYPEFTHIVYNAKVWSRTLQNTWTHEYKKVYLYAIGFNVEGKCGIEGDGCVVKTIPTTVCYDGITDFVVPSCSTQIIAYYDGIDEYLTRTDKEDAIVNVLAEHVNKCLQYDEHLRYFTSTDDHHYTLYYYDRAGSLVQTVPPAGVNPLDYASANAVITPDPSHKFQTYYRYNTRGQVVWQKTPDAGESLFWYNDKGQLILSQNAEQNDKKSFSFTNYDELGRIVLVGKINGAGTDLISNNQPDLLAIKEAIQQQSFPFGILNNNVLSELTSTVYDRPVYVGGIIQQNLLNRVSATYYYDNHSDLVSENGRGTLYSYDELGNVKTMLQDLSTNIFATVAPERKRIDYEYDLVSGKVNKVKYQPGKPDQFTHRYEYDADNRLTDVFTTKDGIIEHHDAKYYYYPHGPLARVELGDRKVQGIDYYYTLQGWLKGVNNPAEHADKDGFSGAFASMGADELQFQLGYFGGDYKPIGGIAPPDIFTQYQAKYDNASVPEEKAFYKNRGNGLYNGNIALMATGIGAFANEVFPAGRWQINEYQYDQLNRIKAMNSRGLYNPEESEPFTNAVTSVQTRYSYDPNGNIKHLSRTAWKKDEEHPVLMDDMTYYYKTGSQLNNQLLYVNDEDVDDDLFSVDIDNQLPCDVDVNAPSCNYAYDKIGNLVSDISEGIEEIKWNVYGKIASIKYSFSQNKDDIDFLYDATGNRVAKIVRKKDNPSVYTSTWYVRDAQGNVLYTEVRKPEENNIQVTNKEYSIYGSSRLGIYHEVETDPTAPVSHHDFERNVGTREYELTNHLGNVLATVSDYKLYDNNTYYAEVLTAQDYYPFGMIMPGRSYTFTGNSSLNRYRFGFNGKELDRQGMGGGGSTYDYGFRIYNPQLGKFLSVDPLCRNFPWWTPYQFAGNTPIQAIDLDGLEIVLPRLMPFPVEPLITLPKPSSIPIPPIHGGEFVMPPVSPMLPNELTAGQPKVDISQSEPIGIDWQNSPPSSPEELSPDWEDITHPDNQSGSRNFRNKETEEEIRWDPGKEGATGWEAKNHWHRLNPNRTSKMDQYLDKNGQPVPRGSGPSHIGAPKVYTLPEVVVTPKPKNIFQRIWKEVKNIFKSSPKPPPKEENPYMA